MYVGGTSIGLGAGNFTGLYAVPGGTSVSFSTGSSSDEVFAAYTGMTGSGLGTPNYGNLYAGTSMNLNTQYQATSDGWVRISIRSVSSCAKLCVNGNQIDLGTGNYTALFPIANGSTFGVLGSGEIFFKFDGSYSGS